MARVFDAFDERLERPVAVKVLRPETEALPGMRQRFQQEARIAARLVHPNIVAVLDYGEDGGSSYLVMERLPGSTLRDEISRGPMSPASLVPVLTQTLAALAAAHKFGVLHRDIKPSNILLDDDGQAKLTDFGIAKSLEGRARDQTAKDLTMTGVVLGTPGYLAPERRLGHAATVQSDLYSVGALMVEALTGRRDVPSPDSDTSVRPPLRDVAARALALDPGDRFPSAEAMSAALREPERPVRRPDPFAATTPLTAAASPASASMPAHGGTALMGAPPIAPPRPPRRPHRALAFALAALAALALVAIVVLLLTNGATTPPPAKTTTHHTTSGRPTATNDTEGTAIRQLASSLAGGGQPGDGALAAALDATAAQSSGPARQAAADQTLALAQVLLAGSGISNEQYQNVVSVLAPTGATVPTTTVPSTPQPPAGSPPGHGHGHGGSQGDQG